MIQDIITIALVCNEEVMLIHAYISSLKGEVLRGDDKNSPDRNSAGLLCF